MIYRTVDTLGCLSECFVCLLTGLLSALQHLAWTNYWPRAACLVKKSSKHLDWIWSANQENTFKHTSASLNVFNETLFFFTTMTDVRKITYLEHNVEWNNLLTTTLYLKEKLALFKSRPSLHLVPISGTACTAALIDIFLYTNDESNVNGWLFVVTKAQTFITAEIFCLFFSWYLWFYFRTIYCMIHSHSGSCLFWLWMRKFSVLVFFKRWLHVAGCIVAFPPDTTEYSARGSVAASTSSLMIEAEVQLEV